jgi:hypothetical protein
MIQITTLTLWAFREPLVENSWYNVSLYAFRQIPSTPRYTNILFNIPVVCASRYLNFIACFQQSCQGQSSPSISRYRSCNGVINRYKNALDNEQVFFAFLKILNAELAMSNHLPPWSRIGAAAVRCSYRQFAKVLRKLKVPYLAHECHHRFLFVPFEPTPNPGRNLSLNICYLNGILLSTEARISYWV